MKTLYLLGRTLFGGFFLLSGVHHFRDRAELTGEAAMKGTPAPDAAVLGSGALLVTGGLSVLTGVKPREGLAALVAFLVPVTLQIHRFWDIDDPQQRQNEMIHFSKNVALIGAALMMLQIPQPWPLALDTHRGERLGHVSYPRLSPSELRALPA